MPDSLGARLRRQREDRQIDLISISHQTKIKLALLEALERDDVSQWPSGIFRRAYIRAYAHIIGLDPDVVVREFLEVHPDPGDVFLAAGEELSSDDPSRKDAPPPMRLRYIVDSAIESLARLRRASAGEGKTPVDPSPGAVRPVHRELPVEGVPQNVRVAGGARDDEIAAPESDDDTVPFLPVPAAARSPQPMRIPVPVDDRAAASGPPTPAVQDDVATDVDRVPSSELQRTRKAGEAALLTVQEANDSALETLAGLCTEFGVVTDRSKVQLLLQNTARALDAAGLIVWLWDEAAAELRPALAYGYPDKILAHLPTVRRDADNATAAAFRSATSCEMRATAHASAALVVPLLIPGDCAGVLAIELNPGLQPTRTVRASAKILASALTQLVLRSQSADRDAPSEPAGPPAAPLGTPLRPGTRRLSDAV
jgi:cytoskeletal protein RodZ